MGVGVGDGVAVGVGVGGVMVAVGLAEQPKRARAKVTARKTARRAFIHPPPPAPRQASVPRILRDTTDKE